MNSIDTSHNVVVLGGKVSVRFPEDMGLNTYRVCDIVYHHSALGKPWYEDTPLPVGDAAIEEERKRLEGLLPQ